MIDLMLIVQPVLFVGFIVGAIIFIVKGLKDLY